MDVSRKLTMLHALLEDEDVSDDLLLAYLEFCGREILHFLYLQLNGVPPEVTEVPDEYIQVQIMGVIAGYNIRGGENQSVSVENGIHRHWHYTDMVEYVRSHVIPYARVI